MNNRKILMIVNEFPPTGESGVQRPLKFLKYLDRLNWETHVVTPKEPVKSIIDETLKNDIPSQAHIYHTKNWGIKAKKLDKIEDIRTNNSNSTSSLKWKLIKLVNDVIFPIDKQIGWVPFAYSKSVKLIKKHKIRNIYITGFPFSAFLVGILLKIRFKDKIFFLADYRDSWSYEPKIEQMVSIIRLKIMRFFDELTLIKCDHMVSVTKPIVEEYVEHYPFLKDKNSVITNGADGEDFKGLIPKIFDKKTIVYMGKFYGFKRSPKPFLVALDKFIKEYDEDIQFIHIGTLPKELLEYIDDKGYNFYRYLGYKTHHEALEYCLGAEALLLCINNDPSSKYVHSGKLFEYINLGKPIIGLVPPDGIVEELINKHKIGVTANIDSEQEIFDALLKLSKLELKNIPEEVIYDFSREKLTKDLINIYEKSN